MFSRGPKTGKDSRFGPGNNEDNNKIIVLVRSKKYRRRFTKKKFPDLILVCIRLSHIS